MEQDSHALCAVGDPSAASGGEILHYLTSVVYFFLSSSIWEHVH